MTTVTQTGSSASVAGLPGAASTGTAADASISDVQDRFLTLLVSQLRNQDPLNPLDNAQITSQLAQLSTVTGINKLNTTLEAMQASSDARQYLQAAGLVGHDAVVAGNALTVRDGTGTGALNLAADADQVTVTIKDAGGNTVRTLELGAQSAGVVSFDWDGRDDVGAAQKDGKYTISVTATGSGKAVGADPLAVARVSGLVPGANGGTLELENLGTASLGDVKLIH